MPCFIDDNDMKVGIYIDVNRVGQKNVDSLFLVKKMFSLDSDMPNQQILIFG